MIKHWDLFEKICLVMFLFGFVIMTMECLLMLIGEPVNDDIGLLATFIMALTYYPPYRQAMEDLADDPDRQ